MSDAAGTSAAEAALYQARPAFIVGCPRSGTTLVKMMLDAHPAISCGPETLFLRHIADLERLHLRLTQFLITEEEWHERLRELFLWLHVRRAAQLGKTRWVDKSPSYAMIPDFLDTLFPNCQIVHVIRDPYDVVDSWRRRWGRRSALRAARLWPLHVERARRFGSTHPDRYFEIRYEDMVRSPEQIMRQLIEWFDEPWDDRVLDFELGDLGGRRPRSRGGPSGSGTEESVGHPWTHEYPRGRSPAGTEGLHVLDRRGTRSRQPPLHAADSHLEPITRSQTRILRVTEHGPAVQKMDVPARVPWGAWPGGRWSR